jgi:hypothetical protein
MCLVNVFYLFLKHLSRQYEQKHGLNKLNWTAYFLLITYFVRAIHLLLDI